MLSSPNHFAPGQLTVAIRLHLTLGDPTGVGPEVVVRALCSGAAPQLLAGARLVVHGHEEVLRRACDLVGPQTLSALPELELREPRCDAPFESSGRAQLMALEQAVDSAVAGEVEALVTAPIQKRSMREAGFGFSGHTDLLAHRFGGPVAMMFVSPTLKVSLATIHLPLAEVPRALTSQRLEDVLLLTALTLGRDFGLASPRIAVAGLNPHAGEGGVLGCEEREVMHPAMERVLPALRRELCDAVELLGPMPADTVFRLAARGRCDAVVAAYHDQALIPIKLMDFERAVNVTLGLPFVRTSPAHGTAHDIAWTGRADPRSTEEAIRLALSLARSRRRSQGAQPPP